MPGLRDGVRMVGGEGRARYVYARDGAGGDVLSAWREALGDRMWVVSRDEAIASGWFGPSVREDVRERIGDVIAAAHAPIGVFDRSVDSVQASLAAHHGSMTSAEQLVPLLQFRA